MGDVGQYAALRRIEFAKCHSPTGNVTTQEKNPSEHGFWGVILTNRGDGHCTELGSAIEYYERDLFNHHTYIGIDVIDVILGAERTAASLSHVFPLPTRTWVLGGDFDKSW